jgi:hypothetical protein
MAYTIDQWKDLLKNQKVEFLQQRLKDEEESIKFLESIYMTGGENNIYSEKFQKAAYQERQESCQLTSAIHSLLREYAKE